MSSASSCALTRERRLTVLSVDVSAADAEGANGAERAAFLSPVQIGTDYYGSVV